MATPYLDDEFTRPFRPSSKQGLHTPSEILWIEPADFIGVIFLFFDQASKPHFLARPVHDPLCEGSAPYLAGFDDWG